MLADRFARRSVNSPISAFRRRGSMNGFTELPRLPVERWLCRSCPWRRPAPGTFGRSPNRDVHPWFASDSPLEGTGFEPSVPGKSDEAFRTASGARRRTFGFGLLPIPLLERRLQRTQFIPIHRVLIRPLRRWATSNAAALTRDFSLRDLRRDQPGVERVALKVLRAGDTHAPGF